MKRNVAQWPRFSKKRGLGLASYLSMHLTCSTCVDPSAFSGFTHTLKFRLMFKCPPESEAWFMDFYPSVGNLFLLTSGKVQMRYLSGSFLNMKILPTLLEARLDTSKAWRKAWSPDSGCQNSSGSSSVIQILQSWFKGKIQLHKWH